MRRLLLTLTALLAFPAVAGAEGPGPKNVVAPTITGTAQVGHVLTINNGTWEPTPSTYSYSWERCNSEGLSCSFIVGAGAQTYTPVTADEGHKLQALVAAWNTLNQFNWVRTAPTPVITAGTSCGEQTAWAPASKTQVPLSDSEAAACVTHRPEVHAANSPFNEYVPSESELSEFHATSGAGFNSLAHYVTGKPGLTKPSTDDLIQWAAKKWGIPADWLRAMGVGESNWYQLPCTNISTPCNSEGGPAGAGVNNRGFGDLRTTSSETWSTPVAAVGIEAGKTATSLGIMQVKSENRGASDPHPGTKTLRWKSTAFNVDYNASILRYYYDGLCEWCNAEQYEAYRTSTTRSEAQQWLVFGAWRYSPAWGGTGFASQKNAGDEIQTMLGERRWEQPGF